MWYILVSCVSQIQAVVYDHVMLMSAFYRLSGQCLRVRVLLFLRAAGTV